MTAFTGRLFAVTATLLLASACGSNTATPTAATPSGTTTPSKSTTRGGVLGVATTSLGPVLVDSQGMTVYLLTADKPGPVILRFTVPAVLASSARACRESPVGGGRQRAPCRHEGDQRGLHADRRWLAALHVLHGQSPR
jgi:hypothetical protein